MGHWDESQKEHQRETSVLFAGLEGSLKMERTSKYGARSVTARNAGADGNGGGSQAAGGQPHRVREEETTDWRKRQKGRKEMWRCGE